MQKHALLRGAFEFLPTTGTLVVHRQLLVHVSGGTMGIRENQKVPCTWSACRATFALECFIALSTLQCKCEWE